ncbi:hypothetical protein FACS189437_07800 [Bacteroidia bacterium]|nr:hypothetical protein FACS189437_07800 [Bacteroidia bacterium]
MKMKKMMLLMLTLLVLGTASMNAQVRIGGEIAPAGGAVLDLNTNDNATNPAASAGGLSLPRVALATETQQLSGKNPKPGTIVYNTGSTLQGTGLYVWTNHWKKVGIDIAAADTGKILSNDGDDPVWINRGMYANPVRPKASKVQLMSYQTTWTKIAAVTIPKGTILPANSITDLTVDPPVVVQRTTRCVAENLPLSFTCYIAKDGAGISIFRFNAVPFTFGNDVILTIFETNN